MIFPVVTGIAEQSAVFRAFLYSIEKNDDDFSALSIFNLFTILAQMLYVFAVAPGVIRNCKPSTQVSKALGKGNFFMPLKCLLINAVCTIKTLRTLLNANLNIHFLLLLLVILFWLSFICSCSRYFFHLPIFTHSMSNFSIILLFFSFCLIENALEDILFGVGLSRIFWHRRLIDSVILASICKGLIGAFCRVSDIKLVNCYYF